MSEVAIRARGLSKRYVLGERGAYSTLREAMTGWMKGALKEHVGQRRRSIWALSNVSFDLHRGEVLGIIGSNGAGKSTLLKILSRITEPTAGRAEVNGRIGCLLEVGTGFHPELTGRQNIYLNGAILGMSRREVRRKFDAIVDFAGVDRFIETPVKRYSSGMQMRLAFAVAAHLDPEILIVDEVLAVGDAAFQAKCLRKMESVSREEGRTILFVSHNMGVIRNLCTRALLLESGTVVGEGDVDEQISRYLGVAGETDTDFDLETRSDRTGDGTAKIVHARIGAIERGVVGPVLSGEPFQIELDYRSTRRGGRPRWALSLFNDRGFKVCHLDSEDRGCDIPSIDGDGRVSVTVFRPPFPPGVYTADVRLLVDGAVADYLQRAFTFRVEAGDYYEIGRVTPSHGEVVYVDHVWSSPMEDGE